MRKSLTLIIKEEADAEIVDAFNWYEEQQEGLGEKFLAQLSKVFQSINKTPSGFTEFDRFRQVPLKKFPFVVLYEVIDTSVVVYAVFHTHRNPSKKAR